jgi:hypothetical protein
LKTPAFTVIGLQKHEFSQEEKYSEKTDAQTG